MKRETARELCNFIRGNVREATFQRRNELQTTDAGIPIKQDGVDDYIPSKRVYEVVARMPFSKAFDDEDSPRMSLFVPGSSLSQIGNLSIDISLEGEDQHGFQIAEIVLHDTEGDELRPKEQEMYDMYSGLQEVVSSSVAACIAVQYETWDELKYASESELKDISGIGPSRARAVRRYLRFNKSGGARPLGEDIPSSGVL